MSVVGKGKGSYYDPVVKWLHSIWLSSTISGAPLKVTTLDLRSSWGWDGESVLLPHVVIRVMLNPPDWFSCLLLDQSQWLRECCDVLMGSDLDVEFPPTPEMEKRGSRCSVKIENCCWKRRKDCQGEQTHQSRARMLGGRKSPISVSLICTVEKGV